MISADKIATMKRLCDTASSIYASRAGQNKQTRVITNPAPGTRHQPAAPSSPTAAFMI
jgi:hypothetical protein